MTRVTAEDLIPAFRPVFEAWPEAMLEGYKRDDMWVLTDIPSVAMGADVRRTCLEYAAKRLMGPPTLCEFAPLGP